jgi:hypothetical protein
MNATAPDFVARAAFSIFGALFFVTPVCTLFLPFCSFRWFLGLSSIALLLFLLTGKWSNEQSDASGTERSLEHHAERNHPGGPNAQSATGQIPHLSGDRLQSCR